jgi:hypothetical protein
MDRSLRDVGLGMLFGAALGLAVGLWSHGAGDATVGSISEAGTSAPVHEAARQGEAARREAMRPETPSTQSAPQSASRVQVDTKAGPITAELLEYARQGIRAGWASQRKDAISEAELQSALDQFEQMVSNLPRTLGAQLAHQRTKEEARLEDLKTGGVFELLDKLGKDRGPVRSLTEDRAGFERMFARQSPGTSVHGDQHLAHPDQALVDGATLQFPPGVFQLGNLMREADPFPRDVTVAGAGMDQTLLLMGDLGTRGRLRQFTIRDCTVYHDCSVFDQRQEGATIQLERVRFLGFDCGAGGSSLINTRDLAVFARQCQFAGGYGRNPQGHANLFDVRTTAMVARFEDCSFTQMSLGTFYPGGTILFVDCRMVDLFDEDLRRVGIDPRLDLVRCSVTTMGQERRQELKRKDLGGLFPNWETRISR